MHRKKRCILTASRPTDQKREGERGYFSAVLRGGGGENVAYPFFSRSTSGKRREKKARHLPVLKSKRGGGKRAIHYTLDVGTSERGKREKNGLVPTFTLYRRKRGGKKGRGRSRSGASSAVYLKHKKKKGGPSTLLLHHVGEGDRERGKEKSCRPVGKEEKEVCPPPSRRRACRGKNKKGCRRVFLHAPVPEKKGKKKR